jgi:phosphatidylglycerophosphate synthase
MILSREIIALPFAIFAYMKGNMFPSVKVIGKITTVFQALTIGAILFKINVVIWPLVFLTCFVGILSGITYAKDFLNLPKKKEN